MEGPVQIMTTAEAEAFRTAYAADSSALLRRTKAQLIVLEAAELAQRGMQRLAGGPVTKDEYLSSILGFRYPVARRDEMTHVLYHNPGESWSACPWCHPHAGEHCDCGADTGTTCTVCGAIAGIPCDPGVLGPMLNGRHV